jgi:hypothetical protein
VLRDSIVDDGPDMAERVVALLDEVLEVARRRIHHLVEEECAVSDDGCQARLWVRGGTEVRESHRSRLSSALRPPENAALPRNVARVG